ncbi:MAG: molecular chaperone DnaJ [Candidatus Terrybacteria bacterium]|nr:molecular chaperone DnaJ [Candidatus Terrybacteria bacterium]
MHDYYNILGIPRNASKEEIKKAYRKLAHQHHPDKTKGEDKKFKEINEAYQVLSDEKKRAEYDTYGRVFSEGAGPGGFGFSAQGEPSSGWDFGGPAGGWDLNDIFENFFDGFAGGGRRTRAKKRGRDISIDLSISFEEAIFGTERKVLLSKTSLCDKCKGTGAEPETSLEKCPACQGAGRIYETKKSFFGAFTSLKECGKCSGKGNIPLKKCSICKGQGVFIKTEEVSVHVPAGIQDGEMINLSGMGEAVAGGIGGDLYIKINTTRHPLFRREGENLAMDLNIKLSEALLGSEREIKTLDGMIKLKVPSGINSGEILRVRGKGVPRPASLRDGSRGDLMIKIFVNMPKKISRHAQKLIEELKNEGL